MLSTLAHAGLRVRHDPSGFAAVLLLVAAMWHGTAAAEDYLGIFGHWESRVFQAEDGSHQCAARALHPALVDGDILWVFNTHSRDTLSRGYLAVDRRLGADARSAHLQIDDGRRFQLQRGHDLHFYNAAEDGSEIFTAMERRAAMSVVLDVGGPQAISVPVSLIGFTRASSAARLACDF